MTMTPRRRRMVLVGLILLGGRGRRVRADCVPGQPSLLLPACGRARAGKAPAIACSGSAAWSRKAAQARDGSMEVRFVVTDFQKDVTVSYSGVLPDLFREGQGVIARGKLGPTAYSSRTKCWRSTTRTTCRRSGGEPAQAASTEGARADAVDVSLYVRN